MSRSFVGKAGRGAVIVIFTTVLGGCVLMCAAGVLAQSAFQSNVTPSRLRGADIVVTAPQTLDQDADLPVALPERAVVPASLQLELAKLPSITAVVGDISFPAALSGAQVDEVATAGHGWSSVSLLEGVRVMGTAPRGDDEVAVHVSDTTSWRLGERMSAFTAGRPAELTITAIVRGSCAQGHVCGLYFADRTATLLAGRLKGPKSNSVDLVALKTSGQPTTVAAEVQRVVGDDYLVFSGSRVGEAEVLGVHAARGFLLILASSFSGVMLLIVGFAVAGALSVSVAGQRRDLALLRAVGATPRQVRRVIARQAMRSAFVATLPGTLLGYLIADAFGDLLADRGLLPPRLALSFGPLPGLAAACLMAASVRLAAWAASLGPSQLSPVEAINEGEIERQTPSSLRFRAGLLVMLASVPIALVPVVSHAQDRAAGTAIAGLVEVIGLGLAGPGLLAVLARTLSTRITARMPVMTWTAISNIQEHAVRSAGAISALAMVVVFALTSVMSNTTVATAAQDEVKAGVRADVAYAAPALGGLPVDLAAQLSDEPGVEAAVPAATTTVLLPYRDSGNDRIESASALVIGPDASKVLDLGVTDGTIEHLTGSTVAVADGVATVGDTKKLILGDGAHVDAKVIATYRRALGFGSIVLSRDLANGHTTSDLEGLALVVLRPGAQAPRTPWGVKRVSATSFFESQQASAQSWVNYAVPAVLLGYVLVSVANRLVVTMTRRRAELFKLQLVGATPGQLLRMVRIEAVLLAAGALGGGLVLAAIPLGLVGAGYLGRPWASGPMWLLPVMGLLILLISWTAYELPARRLIARPNG
jgi:putative ABC transport system permease protein